MKQICLTLQLTLLLGVFLACSGTSAAESDNYARMLQTPVSSPLDTAATGSPISQGDLARFGRSADVALGSTSQLAGYWKGLSSLALNREPTMRGAREVAVYAQVSPAVVLILNGDSLGSGTLLDGSGLIVTNWHVVQGTKTVGLIFKPVNEGDPLSSAQVVTGNVIRIDQIADLALVQALAVPTQAHPARLSSISTVQVGDDVHAIGHPTGESWTYTRGIVSQIRRNYQWFTEEKLQHQADVIQTQTPINPGNSGGPLLNNDGEILGINSFKGEGEGLNFAVSADSVRVLLAAKSDRYAKPVQTASAGGGGKPECEPKTIKSWRISDPPGTDTLVDADCHGSGDVIFQTPDDQSKPVLIMIDSKHKGSTDILMVCPNRDGYPTYALYDTTGSGKPNMIGYFRNHEFEPYRMDPYKP